MMHYLGSTVRNATHGVTSVTWSLGLVWRARLTSPEERYEPEDFALERPASIVVVAPLVGVCLWLALIYFVRGVV